MPPFEASNNAATYHFVFELQLRNEYLCKYDNYAIKCKLFGINLSFKLLNELLMNYILHLMRYNQSLIKVANI